MLLSSAPISSTPISALRTTTTPPAAPAAAVGAASSGGRSSGPDAQVSLADYLRRFGRPGDLPESDDEEAILAIVLALSA